MITAIKRLLSTLHPELAGGYHLARKAVVIAIADAPQKEQLADNFRPHYAVDIMPLTPLNQPDERLGILHAVPLPLGLGGGDAMALNLPTEGTLVELAFFNGLPHQPFIRTVLSEGLTLPGINPGDMLIQQSVDAFSKIDNGGNHHRTGADINDTGSRYFANIKQWFGNFRTSHKTVSGNDTEEIGGSKLLEVLGLLQLLAGESAELGAVQHVNITAGKDINLQAARDLLAEIKGKNEITAKSFKFTNGTVELLASLVDMATQVGKNTDDINKIVTAFNGHGHAGMGATQPATQLSAASANVSTAKSNINTLITGQNTPV